jgi:hypothetical protein
MMISDLSGIILLVYIAIIFISCILLLLRRKVFIIKQVQILLAIIIFYFIVFIERISLYDKGRDNLLTIGLLLFGIILFLIGILVQYKYSPNKIILFGINQKDLTTGGIDPKDNKIVIGDNNEVININNLNDQFDIQSWYGLGVMLTDNNIRNGTSETIYKYKSIEYVKKQGMNILSSVILSIFALLLLLLLLLLLFN